MGDTRQRIIETEGGSLDLGPEYMNIYWLADAIGDLFDLDAADAIGTAIDIVRGYQLVELPGIKPLMEGWEDRRAASLAERGDKTSEQWARDLMELCGWEEAQSCSAGDVTFLANALARVPR